MNPTLPCNAECSCDYVKYSPVCSEDGQTSFISACHAGCKTQQTLNGTKVFSDCSCINSTSKIRFERLTGSMVSSHVQETTPTLPDAVLEGGKAFSGNCVVDCVSKFYIFLAVVCLLKFSGATGRASNFLVTVRWVKKCRFRYSQRLNKWHLYSQLQERCKQKYVWHAEMWVFHTSFISSLVYRHPPWIILKKVETAIHKSSLHVGYGLAACFICLVSIYNDIADND